MNMKKSNRGNFLKSSTRILLGIPLIGAMSSEVNKLPSGTAKTISGTAVGLQSFSLLGEGMKNIPKSYKY